MVRPRGVPADEARAHLRQVLKATFGNVLAGEIGLSEKTIKNVLDPRVERIDRHTAETILAVPAPLRRPRGGLHRPIQRNFTAPTATTRQLRAMAVMGLSIAATAARTGLAEAGAVSRNRNRPRHVLLTTARRVDEAYTQAVEDLYRVWPSPILPDGRPEVAAWAIARGWHGPCAWSSDTIGKPSAQPRTEDLTPIVCRDLLQVQIAHRRAGRVPRRAA